MRGKRQVLIVDDDLPVLEAMEAALGKAFHVFLAPDAFTAVDVLQREAVDLVILDVILGEESGLDFLGRLRETSDVPVLLISAYGTKEMVIAGLRARANDYLDKPFAASDLLNRVQALVGQGPRPDHIAARTRRFIQQHYMQCWTVEGLAKELRLTVRTMRRMFGREYRQSVLDFLEEVRIVRACELLASTDLPIQNVAAEVGYRDPDYFGRVFRQHFGRRPRDFRGEHRVSHPNPLRPAA